ncbi:hypothetical protein [Ornithinimicrobium kibberense]|uniref:hypothetical protein n=1 Tax=Ornithinimicrobium kibberense TaxID=282060 RepID=UPI003611EA95
MPTSRGAASIAQAPCWLGTQPGGRRRRVRRAAAGLVRRTAGAVGGAFIRHSVVRRRGPDTRRRFARFVQTFDYARPHGPPDGGGRPQGMAWACGSVGGGT